MAPAPSGNYRANEYEQKPESPGLGTWVQYRSVFSSLAHMEPEPHPEPPDQSQAQVLAPTVGNGVALVYSVD